MTRGLRRRHLLVFLVLALALPIGFFFALAGRRAVPAEKSLPARLVAPESPR